MTTQKTALINDPRSQQAIKDVGKALIASLALFGGLRAAVGVGGNISRNIRRKKRREETTYPKEVNITFPAVKKAYTPAWGPDKPKPPWWMLPALVGGIPMAGAAGWAGMSKILKAYRRSRVKDELELAKQEFEDALAEESQSKFACSLDKLATAYVNGEIDGELNKTASIDSAISGVAKDFSNTLPGAAYLTLLLGLGGVGALAGWHLGGDSPENKRRAAYEEAIRRRKLSRPPGLIARTGAISTTPQHDEPTESPSPDDESYKPMKYGSVKAAAGIGNVLRRFLLPAAGAAAGTGATLWGTNKWLQSKGGINSLVDNAMTNSQPAIQSLLESPRGKQFISRLYTQLLPAFKREFEARNPMIGQMVSPLID